MNTKKNFTDNELKDLDKCLEHFKNSDYTPEQLAELKGYLQMYLDLSREWAAREYSPLADTINQALSPLPQEEGKSDLTDTKGKGES